MFDAEFAQTLFELIPVGVVLIDGDARVCAANATAAAILRRGSGLRILAGRRLTTEVATARPGFEAFLGRVLSVDGSRSPAQSFRIIVPQKSGAPVVVTGAPHGLHDMPGSPPASRAVLCLREFAQRKPQAPDIELLRLRYKLTAAEAGLARSLLAGKTIVEHSRERDVSPSTTRTQLQSLLDKVGVRRQVDLIRVLAAG
ncbi:MAG TPA: PAS domain-containing protein [Burkholderiales bacterium]|nr:PAS domain-containing protein [Burkholderiales bacterium]